jgi:hypothetical protein
MTPADLNFATECLRGIHTAVAAFKRWAQTKELRPEDEALIKSVDHTAAAMKEWLRSKVLNSLPHE